MASEDSLIEVPFEKWSELRDVFKNRWTIGVPHYYALHLNINHPAVREAFKFTVYCPYGDTRNGLVITNVKGIMDVLIIPINNDTRNLEDAIAETKLIDWTKETCIDLLTATAADSLQRLQPRLGLKECNIMFTTTFFFDRKREPFPENRPLPDGMYLAPIKLEHIGQVDKSWPYRHQKSHWYFSTLASNGLSYALYSSKDHCLTSWVFLNDYSFICHLYCEESYRRLGCAKYLIEHLVNEQLKKGEDAYGFVVEGNERSARLFKKLGFDIIDDVAWAFVRQ